MNVKLQPIGQSKRPRSWKRDLEPSLRQQQQQQQRRSLHPQPLLLLLAILSHSVRRPSRRQQMRRRVPVRQSMLLPVQVVCLRGRQSEKAVVRRTINGDRELLQRQPRLRQRPNSLLENKSHKADRLAIKSDKLDLQQKRSLSVGTRQNPRRRRSKATKERRRLRPDRQWMDQIFSCCSAQLKLRKDRASLIHNSTTCLHASKQPWVHRTPKAKIRRHQPRQLDLLQHVAKRLLSPPKHQRHLLLHQRQRHLAHPPHLPSRLVLETSSLTLSS
jgi:hypothetical protein